MTEPCYRRLVAAGIPPDSFEFAGYRRLKREGHACILFVKNRCRFHDVKPETCRAGPFTFDVNDGSIVLFLKKEEVCPLVRMLKDDPEAYRQQYADAVRSIRAFVAQMPDDELAAVCRVEEPATEYVETIPRNGGSP